MTPPVLGMPFTLKFALNQTTLPDLDRSIRRSLALLIPLPASLAAEAEPQVRLVGENWIGIVLCPTSEAVPVKV